MRTEKYIRHELLGYRCWLDSLHSEIKFYKDTHQEWVDRAEREIPYVEQIVCLLERILSDPELIECPYCKNKEEPLWVGDMRTIHCDCGAMYAGGFGWTRK